MPVVTANWPTKLNHPVTQLKKAAVLGVGASMAAQKYGPPEVGCALVISAMLSPTNIVKKLTTSQPLDMVAGPPLVSPYSKSVVMPVMTEMMEKETPKLWIRDQSRLSSCL